MEAGRMAMTPERRIPRSIAGSVLQVRCLHSKGAGPMQSAWRWSATALAAGAPPARETAAVPIVTYGMGAPVKIHLNGETVHVIPIRAAHTGGDTIIRFEDANVIMIGDFYRNFGYPFIDINNGGTLKGMLEALDEMMRIAGPDTKLV